MIKNGSSNFQVSYFKKGILITRVWRGCNSWCSDICIVIIRIPPLEAIDTNSHLWIFLQNFHTKILLWGKSFIEQQNNTQTWREGVIPVNMFIPVWRQRPKMETGVSEFHLSVGFWQNIDHNTTLTVRLDHCWTMMHCWECLSYFRG